MSTPERLCTVCGQNVPTEEAMKAECPRRRKLFRDDAHFEAFEEKRRLDPTIPPIGHTLTMADYMAVKFPGAPTGREGL